MSCKFEPSPGSLYLRTQELLAKDKRTLMDIATASGLPYFWLRQFKWGKNPAASVNRVQKLYETLAGKSLKV